MEGTDPWLRRRAAPAACLVGALLLLFLPVIAGGESFFGRDATPFFYPMKRNLVESVMSGRFPLWNPFVAGGGPFFATLQPGVLYPGSLLLYVLPFPHSVDWLIILHFLFAGAGWYLLLRHRGLSPAAATFGAIAFMLGGFFVSLGNFINNLQAASWAPWLFLAWASYLRDGAMGRLLVFGAVCVAAFLGGEPQLLGLLLLVVFAWGLMRLTPTNLSRARQAGAFGLAGILALSVSGLQLLPFIELLAQSVRTTPLDLGFAASLSQDLSGLANLVVPPALGVGELGFTTRYLASTRVPWLLSLYPGVLVAVFCWRGVRCVERREAALWCGLGGIGLLLALGVHTPVYPALFHALPPMRSLRYPEKFAVLFAVGIPFLAGAAFQRWRSAPAEMGPVSRAMFGLAVPYGILTAALWLRPDLPGAFCPAGNGGPLLCAEPRQAAQLYAGTALRLAVILAIAGVVVMLRQRETLRPALAAWLLVLLAALDLALAHRAVNVSVESDIYTTRPWAAEALAERAWPQAVYRYRGTPLRAPMGTAVGVRGARELSNLYLYLQAAGPNTGQTLGWLQQDGLQGVELQSVALTHDAAIHAWAGDPVRYLRMFNVKYYADPTATADSMTGLIDVARHPVLPLRLFEVPDPLPRAYIADGWELAAGPGQALRRSLEGDRPLRRVVLERRPEAAGSIAADPDPPAPPGRIVAATWEAERVRLITRTSAPAVLVLLDRWYPGWQVTVNGEEAPLLRANGVFRAVEVPAGEADVEFNYAPASVAIGGWMTAAGVAASLGLLWWSRRPRRSRRSHP